MGIRIKYVQAMPAPDLAIVFSELVVSNKELGLAGRTKRYGAHFLVPVSNTQDSINCAGCISNHSA
jgi:hypothetical protein